MKTFSARAAAFLALCLLATACLPAQSGVRAESAAAREAFEEWTVQAPVRTGIELRGDPDFDPERLSDGASRWYEELWAVLGDERSEYALEGARSDNLYHYARSVHTHVTSLLTAFRFSGDLRLLDEVDVILEEMRERLSDGWRDTEDGRDGVSDGYLNWVYRGSGQLAGKDTHEVNEMRTHALVAQAAWAFHANRDLESPAGIEYGERADAWRSYLERHFEPKWRERNELARDTLPFIERPQVHASVAFVKYHVYMLRITGDEAYRWEAERLTDQILEEFRVVESDAGPALVWPRTLQSLRGNAPYLMPTTYVRYVISDVVDLHLEGVYRWADPRVPAAIANAFASFVIDDGTTDFARDIGGGADRAGLSASRSRDWGRFPPHQYAYSPFAFIAPWDASGTVAEVSAGVYENVREADQRAYIPAALFVHEEIRSRE